MQIKLTNQYLHIGHLYIRLSYLPSKGNYRMVSELCRSDKSRPEYVKQRSSIWYSAYNKFHFLEQIMNNTWADLDSSKSRDNC